MKQREIGNTNAILVLLGMTIIGGLLSIYGYSFMFAQNHNLTPIALSFGLVLFALGVIGLFSFVEQEGKDE